MIVGQRLLQVRSVAAFVFFMSATSCGLGKRSLPSTDESTALGGDIAARVGSQGIPLALVERVAAAQQVSPREAVRRLVDDEVAAIVARSHGLDRVEPAAWQLVAARARWATDRMIEEARHGGSPTDEEVKVLSERHWIDVDRPPSVLVIHAIALRPKDASLAERAHAVADQLHDAVRSATDANDFEAKVKAVEHDARIDVRVERLPAFISDGSIVGGGGRMNEVFAKAASALPFEGATSDVVETTFGWHVIRVLEKLPEVRLPLEERRTMFTEEAYSLRAHNVRTARLNALKAANSVAVAPAAEQLMRSVVFSSHPPTPP